MSCRMPFRRPAAGGGRRGKQYCRLINVHKNNYVVLIIKLRYRRMLITRLGDALPMQEAQPPQPEMPG